ncbi:baseplate J/gp47 family protein [Selenomonas ruminantium]|uniref:baseplate assembly protein n=1 Tax=Selenomonas ruminantium TaxID=971 RepID=UPI0026ED9D7B|nr:baseplate J/gp47 family protein [Selenomonas ruminantium]
MELKKLPDITFAESDPAAVEQNILTTVEALLGRKLARADPLRIFLMGIEALMIQQRILIDESAKQGLLAYATGDNLDHIGVLVGTDRLEASAATVTLQFSLNEARETGTVIPKGTRATAGDGVMFATDATAVILAGTTSITAPATCTETGTAGNDYTAGEIIRLVDPVPFVAGVTNTTKSAGGSETESDDAYRLRIQEAPEQFSTAGPTGAYEYHAKRANSLIVDVSVDSPSPGEVVVRPLLKDGGLPDTEIINTVAETLNDRKVRPLTDHVTVEAPTAVSYDINLSYWIDREDATEAANIQAAAETAINDFVSWQRQRLGRDINPTELYYRLRAAGVKRAEISQPVYTAITRAQVALAGTITATFEGLEDD